MISPLTNGYTLRVIAFKDSDNIPGKWRWPLDRKKKIRSKLELPHQNRSWVNLDPEMLSFSLEKYFFNSKAMSKTIIDKDICSEDKQKGFF